jgi:integrase
MLASYRARRPKFDMLDGEKVRQGFVEHGDFCRLLGHLPDALKPAVEFLYYGGWRKSPVVTLNGKRLTCTGGPRGSRPRTQKTESHGCCALSGRLWEIVQVRAKVHRLDCPYVFHNDGKKIGDFRKTWKTACRKAGLDGLLIHDLRRCAARNLSRAGVSEQVAMKITGHKTPSMYRRYRIIDENELREAQDKMQRHLETQTQSKVAAIGSASA